MTANLSIHLAACIVRLNKTHDEPLRNLLGRHIKKLAVFGKW